MNLVELSSQEVEKLSAVANAVASYVRTELGGEIYFFDNLKWLDEQSITLRWKKFDELSNKLLSFDHKISYTELQSIEEPIALGRSIVEKYCEAVGQKSVNGPETLNAPQPPPQQNEGPVVWDLVIQDMRERDKIGVQKYHTHLQPFNGRETLIDAYQEALDLVVYLRQLIYEMYEGKEKGHDGR